VQNQFELTAKVLEGSLNLHCLGSSLSLWIGSAEHSLSCQIVMETSRANTASSLSVSQLERWLAHTRRRVREREWWASATMAFLKTLPLNQGRVDMKRLLPEKMLCIYFLESIFSYIITIKSREKINPREICIQWFFSLQVRILKNDRPMHGRPSASITMLFLVRLAGYYS
jgi:hypothetical protein